MRFWKWLLAAMAIVVAGLLVFSLFQKEPGPVDTRPVSEQTRQQSEIIDETDPFSSETRSTTDSIEGTVGY